MKRIIIFIVLVVTLASIVHAIPPTPTSWYTHDNAYTRGNRSIDDISGNNATLRNGVVNGSLGQIRQAYLFDGLNDDVSIPDSSLYDFTEFSIAMWVNMTSTCGGKDPLMTMIGATTQWQLDFDCGAGKDFEWTVDSSLSGGTTLSSGQVNPVGRFVSVVVTATLTNMTVYVNGSSMASTTFIKLGNYNAEDFIYLGSTDGAGPFAETTIDEFRIFNRSLNATEVFELYNNGTGTPFLSPPNSSTILIPANNTQIVGDTTPVEWSRGFDLDNITLLYTLQSFNSTGSFFQNIVSNTTSNTTNWSSVTFPDGNYTLQVVTTDGFYVVNGSRNKYEVISHNAAKPVNVSPSNNSYVRGIFNISWMYPEPPVFHTFAVRVFNQTGTQVYAVVYSNSSNTSVPFNSSQFIDGTYTFYINASHGGASVRNSSGLFTMIIDNTIPSLTVTYPDHPLRWGDGRIEGFCNDVNPSNFTFNTTNNTQWITVNDSFVNFFINKTTITSGPNNQTVRLTCIDRAGNQINNTNIYFFDQISPQCNGIVPVVTIDQGQNYMWNLSCVDDQNYFYLNVTCEGGTGFTFFQNNINQTLYNFMDSSGSIQSDMSCTFESADAHTKNNVRRELNKYTVFGSNGNLDMPKKKGMIQYKSGPSISSIDLNFTKEDRVSFKYNYQNNPQNQVRDYVYFVTGNDNVQFIDDKLHKGWFVVDNYYWIDFDLPSSINASYTVEPVNQSVWALTISTTESSLPFQSTGIININTQEQEFIIRPAEQISQLQFNQCPVSLNGTIMLGILLFFGLAVVILGVYAEMGVVVFIGGLIILAVGFTVLGCSSLIGPGVIALGVLIMLLSIVFYMRGVSQ